MSKRFAIAMGLIAALALLVTPASAYTSTFVGKGEVQTAFGLNNSTMQKVHQSVTFQYDISTPVTFECEWYTGPDRNRKRHDVTVTKTIAVQASVASESRKTGQWTGWNLTNGLPALDPGSITITNADCGAEGNEMKSVVEGSVELGESTGGLYAVLNGERRLLTFTG